MALAAQQIVTNDDSSLSAKMRQNYTQIMATNSESIPCVLVATGTFSPVHRMHIINMELAKEHVEKQNSKHRVIGGFISPTHQSYCDSKLENLSISAEHRIKMLSLALNDSDWIEVSPWHPNQAKMQRIESEIGYIADLIKQIWSDNDEYKRFILFYVCGSDLAAFGIYHGFDPYGVCILQRDSCPLKASQINTKAIPPVYLIDIPDKYDAVKACSSTEIRKCLQNGRLISHLTFDNVQQYMIEHDILGASSLKALLSKSVESAEAFADDMEEQKEDKLIIALGSGSIIKQQVVSETFGADNVDIVGLKFASAVNEQPVGKEETQKGAEYRARKAQELQPDASMWIGIENGMYRELPENDEEKESVFHHWVDAGCIVIIYNDDNGDEVTDVLWSDALPIPVESTKNCLTADGKGAKDNGNHTWSPLKDPHRELTNGKKPRKQWLLEAMQKWKADKHH